MIKEEEVLVPINMRNISHYKSLGYDIGHINNNIKISLLVRIVDIPTGSKIIITAICDLCSKSSNIQYSKYLLNFNRNNKGYYSCFACKNIEREKTCMEKYGVSSYSRTDEFKELDRSNWRMEEGYEKSKITRLKKYGVEYYFQTQESKDYNRKWMSSDKFRSKSKETIIKKYGVDSYSKTKEFKDHMTKNKDVITKKIRNTILERYGVDSYFKLKEYKDSYRSNLYEIRELCKKTCMEKYGVDNVSKVGSIMEKIISTKIYKGLIIPDSKLSEWESYKREVLKLTNRNKKQLWENWDGFDYYDGEYIKGNFSYNHTHRFYPSIDHKISTFYGYSNNIPTSEISDISNLCVTKRFINSIKNSLIEEDFINTQ